MTTKTILSKDKTALYYAGEWWKLPFSSHGYFVKAADRKTFAETRDVQVAKILAETMNLIAKHSS